MPFFSCRFRNVMFEMFSSCLGVARPGKLISKMSMTRIFVDNAIHTAILLFLYGTIVVNATRGSVFTTSHETKQTLYKAEWAGQGQWIGRAWWANPLWDWKKDGYGGVQVPAAKQRALSLLPLTVAETGEYIALQSTITFSNISPGIAGNVAAGFALSRIGVFEDYRSAVVYPKSQLPAVIRSDGLLSLPGVTSKTGVSLKGDPILLTLQGFKVNGSVLLTLTAKQSSVEVSISTHVQISQVTGVLALITEGPSRNSELVPQAIVTFRNFSVFGSMVSQKPDRSFGPILWTQYTISDGTLRIQAQLSPIDSPETVTLLVTPLSGGKTTQKFIAKSQRLSRTVRFTIANWDSNRRWRYVIQINVYGRSYKWTGNI